MEGSDVPGWHGEGERDRVPYLSSFRNFSTIYRELLRRFLAGFLADLM